MNNTDKVTIRDIYEITEDKTDRILMKLDEWKKEHDTQVTLICSRVSTLEVWKAGLTAKISVVIAGLSFIFTALWSYVKSRIIDQ